MVIGVLGLTLLHHSITSSPFRQQTGVQHYWSQPEPVTHKGLKAGAFEN